MVIAWHTARLGRLYEHLGEERPEQSPDDMAAVMDRWTVATAGLQEGESAE
jgi:hypothetical protein